ncbi:MAG TPA: type II secretion system F family protein [Candidatus Saccharimonadales bacterium]|nr:type II secretion system F family protein [Candidatus Saccharimonadales bacterium]
MSNIKNLTIGSKDKIGLISNLHTMLAAGIPILETVDSLLEDAKGNPRKLLLALRADLVEGQHVAVTFAKFPRIFDKVTVNIIKASEEAGTLDTTLKDIKDNIKRDIEFNNKIKGALIYPMFIMAVFFAVLIMILVVVVPKISTVFLRMNVPLPLPTKIMIYMSDALLKNTFPVILGLGLSIFTLVYLYKRNKRAFVSILISFPVISSMAQKIDLTRFTRSLYLLLGAGIPITSALELTQEVVAKKEMQTAIKHAKEIVFAGKKLSQGLKDNKRLIPSIMIKIIEAGERTGTLDKSMQDVAEYLDYEVSNSLKTLTALIEPLLLVVVGVMVGGMMMAIISPIYGLVGQIGGK